MAYGLGSRLYELIVKPKGIISEVAGELGSLPVEVVKTGVKELVYGPFSERKVPVGNEEERQKQIAQQRRVIQEAIEAGHSRNNLERGKSDKVVPLPKGKAKEMPIIKPPAGISHQPGLKRPTKGKPEIKGFSTG